MRTDYGTDSMAESVQVDYGTVRDSASSMTDSTSCIGIVLLVAGRSRRMGRNKQLLPWRDGTVLDAVCTALRDGWRSVFPSVNGAVLPLVAVTGDNHDELKPILTAYGFRTIQNNRPSDGQGVSLRIGVEHLLEQAGNRQPDGILCSVGDQPLLSADAVSRILQAFIACEDAKSIVVPHYGNTGTPGNPVLFGSYWFDALTRIRGDEGGKSIIRGEGKDFVHSVQILENAGADVDTPEDYRYLRERESEDV